MQSYEIRALPPIPIFGGIAPSCLQIFRSTMEAAAFFVKFRTATPTIKTGSAISEIALQGKIDICHQEQISYVIKCGEAENDIIDGAYGSQSAQIYHGLS